MPPNGRTYRHRKAKEAGPSSDPLATPNRTIRNIVHTARLYEKEIPAHIKKEIDDVETKAKVDRSCTQDEEIMKYFGALLLKPGYARGKVALYLKTLDIAWNQRYLMGKGLVERGEAHEAILLQLDELTMNLRQIAAHLGLQLNANKEDNSSEDCKPNMG